MAQPTMAQSAVALPATNYRAQQLYDKNDGAQQLYGKNNDRTQIVHNSCKTKE